MSSLERQPADSTVTPTDGLLKGKRVGMVSLSPYPADARPRRVVDTLLSEGMTLDFICLCDDDGPRRESQNGLEIYRLPIRHKRGGWLAYLYEYCAFLLASAAILAVRAVRQRYDIIYVHNMPDILVASALVPRILGAKVILDLHDPMPELITTIFSRKKNDVSVRLIRLLEKWSIAQAHAVVTVNRACKDLFARRSCSSDKISVVMNSPDETIFPYRPARLCKARVRSDQDPLIIMYHGALVERNGLDLCVAALAALAEPVCNIVLRVYGRRNAFLDRVLAEADALGVAHHIDHRGARSLDTIAREIEDCHVGIVPNRRNDFTDINTPIRIFEYLACGKPVIAPLTRGIQEYFGADDLLFFAPGDPRDLARAIEYAAQRYSDAIDACERGQKVYRAHSWQSQRETLVHVLRTLMTTTSETVTA